MSDHQIQFALKNMATQYKQAGLQGRNPHAAKGRRITTLEYHVSLLIKQYLADWNEKVDLAITNGQPPKDKDLEVYWYIALAGNLLWAATCFIPVEGQLLMLTTSGATIAGETIQKISRAAAQAALTKTRVIEVMSVVGATVGSGTVEKVTSTTSTGNLVQDAKSTLYKIIGTKREDLQKEFGPLYYQWASQIDALAQRFPIDVMALTDQYLWFKMFPRIPYEGRFNAIYDRALNNVNNALKDFNSQWETWGFKKGRSGEEYKHRKMYGDVWDYSLPDPGPFRPKLKFDDLSR